MKRAKKVLALCLAFCMTAVIALTGYSPAYASESETPTYVYGEHTYRIFDEILLWEEAKLRCEELGGHLVTITDAAEQEFVQSIVTDYNYSCWIGASRLGTDTKWAWVTNEPFEYTHWDAGEPSWSFEGDVESYVGIYARDNETPYSTTGKWNDFRLHTQTIKGYVCEWDYAKSYFVELNRKGVVSDLLEQQASFDHDSKEEVTVEVNYEEGSGKERIFITQNTENALELGNHTPVPLKPAELFDPGMPIYILILDEATGASKSYRTKMQIMSPIADGDLFPGNDQRFSFKLGNTVGLTIPGKIPCFGGTELKWTFDFIPICLEVDPHDPLKVNVVFGANIVTAESGEGGDKISYFKDFSFADYKKSFNKARSKQSRTLKQLKNDFKISNACKMNFFDKKVLGGGTGQSNFDTDLLGYAEMKIINDKPVFTEGQIMVELKISVSYNGQLFIWVVPVYYTIGANMGAGYEGSVININPDTFVPQLEGALSAAIGAKLGSGVGIPNAASVGVAGSGKLNLKTNLNSPYSKVWCDGSANINVRLFGKEVAKSDFLSGEFVLYESGKTTPSAAGSSVSSAGNSQSELYSKIDIHKVYENETRSYADSRTSWLGGETVGSLSGPTLNKQTTLLAENVYPETAPLLCEINGRKVMVMLWDDADRTAVNRSALVYSVYDELAGSWSAPVQVFDDNTADFYPCFRDGYLVWQNEKQPLTDSMTLADIGALGEICCAKWNGSGFDRPIALTSDGTLDTQPVVSASEEGAAVVWLTNTQNDITGTTGSNTIMKTIVRADHTQDAPVVVKDQLNTVTSLAAAYEQSGLCIAYTEDRDNDLQTIHDRDITLIEGSSETVLAQNNILDSNPIFSDGTLYYYSNGNIEYFDLQNRSKHTVFTEPKPGLTDTFKIAQNGTGDVAVCWTQVVDQANEVFSVLKQDGVWGDEVQISDTKNDAKYPSVFLSDSGTLSVAYNNGILLDGENMKHNLYLREVTPSYDLALKDVFVDEETMKVYATVQNVGELTVGSYTVQIRDAGAVNVEKTVNAPLKPGASAELELKYDQPQNLARHDIEVNVSTGMQESDPDNNIQMLTVGNADVKLISIESFEKLPTSRAVAVITNSGYHDTDTVNVHLRKGRADGPIVQTKTLDPLTPGETVRVPFDYSVVDDDTIQWYITTDCSTPEISTVNNAEYFINNIRAELPDYHQDIVLYEIDESGLHVNGLAENNTGTDLSARSVLAVYDAHGRMKHISFSPISIPKYERCSLAFTQKDYQYEKGDTVQLFLLNDGAGPVLPPTERVLTQK